MPVPAGRLAQYFDNASTTALDPAARAEMLPWLGEEFGNTQSVHAWGRGVHEAVELARSRVAALAGVEPEEVAFTSGATEANNWALAAGGWARSPFEHPSARRVSEVLPNSGFGLMAPQRPVEGLCVMVVESETGAVPTPPAVPGARLHRDATQAFGKLPNPLRGADTAAVSAHKLHGPQGVGALIAREARFPSPFLLGGGHEHGRRAGTLNVAGIVGFGAACAVAAERLESDFRHAQDCRAAVLEGLHGMPDMGLTYHTENSPFILSVQLAGILGEAMVVELDAVGFAIGAGTACSAGSTEPSPVLLAAGLSPAQARSTVRVSFARTNTVEAASALGKAMAAAAGRLQGSSP